MNKVKEFVAYYIHWLSSHNDLELEPILEYEVIRTIIDASECFEKESEFEIPQITQKELDCALAESYLRWHNKRRNNNAT